MLGAKIDRKVGRQRGCKSISAVLPSSLTATGVMEHSIAHFACSVFC